MTEAYVWLAVAVLFAATYLAAVKLALLGPSRWAVEQELEAKGNTEGARWLADRFDSAIFAFSLLRTVARLAFFALVLAEVVDLGAEAAMTWGHLLVSGLISVPILWVCTSVLASAVSRHVGSGLIATGLPAIRAITWLCYPLTKAVSFIDEAVRRLSGADLRRGDESEAELLRSIEESQREGGLDEEAATILENVVEFTNTDVAEIMTPRTDIEAIEVIDDLARIRAFIVEVGHSRIPVYKGDVDHIVGILYIRDLVPYLGEDATAFKLEPLLRQPIIVPETKRVRDLLADFQRSEVHMGIVIDEYGGTAGLVTIEDVLEEIVGEIRDEHEPDDEEIPTLVTIDERHAEVDGRYAVDDLNERLGLALPEDGDFDTVGGFVLAQLGRVPSVGETFEAHNARFTALAASPRHVQRVGIELLGAPSPNGEPWEEGTKARRHEAEGTKGLRD
ncbi:MAG: hemolysin family protein [Planctomycetota bacterium]